ncbi:hypothetical protein JWJ90_13365 [Desulfobulbus rhabdoformis]|uniref:hypothetical protein n=1 Tax=Desulfobulbus rhabdoformis TaxID=34032 RepID=UPI0019628A45|nr:hypothetical protein [Desulfobulbus rhabdoformis]MBM9615267.1 hypothetical protein [Desulfobulbus rhabdoformis]
MLGTRMAHSPPKVFVDNCIMSVSETMQAVSKQFPLNWGDSVQWVDVVGYMRKPLPNLKDEWKRNEIKFLPTIGRIAREGKISLFTYFELQSEGWKRSGSFAANSIGNIFSGVSIKSVEAAVDRSYFFQMELGKFIKTQQVIEYCKWLMSPGIEKLADRLSGNPAYPLWLLNNIKNVQRFRELCQGLAEKQYPDAFHLWSAEVNGSDLFLTIDGKFIRAMTQSKRISLPCQPMSPSKLLNELKIEERDPFEFQEGQFYDISGRPK